MGQLCSRTSQWWSSSQLERRVMMVGLENAGKTSILYKMKLGETMRTSPTIGFNVESINHQNLTITVWDMGGRQQLHSLWMTYLPHTDALVYVVDCTDTDERLSQSSELLHRLIKEEFLDNVPLLLLCNKQDVANAKTASQIVQLFKMHVLTDRNWQAQQCVAITGNGLGEALDWLASQISRRKV